LNQVATVTLGHRLPNVGTLTSLTILVFSPDLSRCVSDVQHGRYYIGLVPEWGYV
jgi:hypothetical protein